MKNSLILALVLVSMSSFAKSSKEVLKTGEMNKIKCSTISDVFKNTFSGEINLQTQADEVVFADTVLATIDQERDSKNLLILEEIPGTQASIGAGLLDKGEVTSVTVMTQEDSEVKAYLVINLGMKGMNSRLTVDNKAIYSSSCSVVK